MMLAQVFACVARTARGLAHALGRHLAGIVRASALLTEGVAVYGAPPSPR